MLLVSDNHLEGSCSWSTEAPFIWCNLHRFDPTVTLSVILTEMPHLCRATEILSDRSCIQLEMWFRLA